MALDASSELYILPFKSPGENRFHNLCKNGSTLGSTNEGSKDLLEIRITELPQDLDDDPMLHGRGNTESSTSDFGTAMKHQEIDFESLNQILCKDVVFMSSNPDDTKLCMDDDTPFGEVKNIGSVPVIMFSKEESVHGIISNGSVLSQEGLKYTPGAKAEEDVSDDFIVYKDENDVLASVQVLGVEGMENIHNVWVPDDCAEPLRDVGLHPDELLDSESMNSHLVPIELENNVVFIDAAPLNTTVISKVKTTEMSSQNRPSVISIAVPNGGSCNPNEIQKESESHLALSNKQLPSLLPRKRLKGTEKQANSPPTIVPTSSRSVLKTSIAKKGSKLVTIRPKSSGKQTLKQEHFGSLINQSSLQPDNMGGLLRKPISKVAAKGKSPKSQSLAVVAISSDKTKDLTEIVVSTARGEQVFKGKTSDLISATPNLWQDELSQNCDSSSVEEDEFLDYQPVTDALQRLGVPTLTWVQNKPEDQRMWYCPEKGCKKLFPVLNQLKVHILGHYGVRPYKCDYPNCQWAFYTHFKLKRHKETHLQRKDFKCSFAECGRSFTTIYNLRTHQKLHKRPAEIACPVKDCTELFQTRRSLEFHLKEHGLDHAPYVCPYSSCQKRYYTVNSVNSHIRSHQHKDDEIKCQWPGCSKIFTKPCRLRAHMRTHTGDKPYLCTHPGCAWAFTSSSKLRRHQFKHTNVRNFQCRIDGCGKLFMRSEHLKEHALTHSTERTFQCPHPNCNMKFSAKSSLYVHSKKHRAKVHAVPSESVVDPVTSIPVKVIQSTKRTDSMSPAIFILPELNIEDQIAVQSLPTDNSVQSEISEANQTLDFIPLLSEDEALVAELGNMEHVSFEHNTTVPMSMLHFSVL
ncbi:hypothetical protein ONE63_010696 [Megalurothrips usitatus]|uniref:C2H2-type domain-containing protein n=1 Tax=Megalurothrips usitatus TaxID=439358 RepID=A0AAV7XKN1_9NEOP|nr:hypothetical protein ONE63_010696 [Megalurothrips usitatus]